MIKIDFEFDTKHGIFRDALYLPDDHTYTDTEIEAMKEYRRDNWISVIENPPSQEPLPTIPESVEISGETYVRLHGVPPAGARLIQVGDTWYYKD